jgi:multicomponent Na+:H+ antiporter subunit A
MWLPPLVLGAGGVLVGIVPWILDVPLTAAASGITGMPTTVALRLWHGLTLPLGLSALTLGGVGIAVVTHRTLRTRTWKPRAGSEALYTGTVAALNAMSHRIAPALHSASLRSYVMVIVLTSIVMGGVALVADPGVGSLVPRTSVSVHEVLIVVVILAGAIAATVAKSTMAAVLSLGSVGYGVAMIFLSFGAPDLAMTQFSVETLTVLIYVLVFRHFRSLGALSPRLVRYRDALIAIGLGTFVGALVLLTSTTDTAPRLREYFAEFGPTLGHGRNIVNVILVDFRAFDTLGEITVLSTAAIGVRALLRLASADEPAPPSSSPMSSAIFRTATRLLMPLLLMFAVFLVLRGHNEPGGGFVGGLVAAAAFSLYAMAFGSASARQAVLVRPLTLLGAGLLIAMISGMPAVMAGQPFLTAQWILSPVAVGTPMIFDIGVFLVVLGVVLMMIFNLAEEP